MKLILAIIQDEDAHEVITALNEAKFQVTRLNTKGGFLRAGNTTLMTGVPAEKVDEASFITPVENENKEHTFTVPVEALDKAIDVAAFSAKKEQWYDRKLCFKAQSLDTDAYADGVINVAEISSLKDGEYTVEVSLEGGSGKAGISSPAKLKVEDGKTTATIVWSSKNYDYMKVDDVKYNNLNEIKKTRLVYDNITVQLSKKKTRFQYKLVKKGGRASEFENAIEWLVLSGIVSQIYKVEQINKPLETYRDIDSFKIYVSDLGLLCAKKELIPNDVLYSPVKDDSGNILYFKSNRIYSQQVHMFSI